MIRLVCGGKKNSGWLLDAVSEYEKRLRKPYDLTWQFYDEQKLGDLLNRWPFSGHEYVICCDERGQIISSDEYSKRLDKCFFEGRDVILLVGGAYGFDESVRERADFVWGFSRLVFPHMIARLIAIEQTYRAQEISRGSKYHHV